MAGPPASGPRGLGREIASLLALSLCALFLPSLAALRARSALVDFGPSDTDHVRGFRAGWERDGGTRFHWTTSAASVTLPLSVRGEDLLLRMRVRRHLIEPSHVRLIVEGRTVHRFELQADPKVAYRIVEIALPRLEGRHPFVLSIEAPSDDPRPLGLALDWLEVVRTSSKGRFLLTSHMRWTILIAVLVSFGIPRLAGARLWLAIAHASALLMAASFGAAWDLIATERILREGIGAYVAVGGLTLLLCRLPRVRRTLGLESRAAAGALAVLVLLALAVRLTLLLHPQFYYPDVKVHGLFAWELSKRGLPAFLREFTLNQYRYSLGLQLENGHWYAFPYPPAFYMTTWPLVRLAGYRPEVAVSLLAAAANSLEALLVFGIARRLGRGPDVALSAAAALPLLPLFLARLTLAYFPAIFGHAFDALVVFYLLSHLSHLGRARVILGLAALIATSLLVYTQSLVNFGILLALFLLFELVLNRTPEARRCQAGLVAGGLLGAVVALAVFYGRYVPIFLDMRRGVPMAQERVLLERLERTRSAPEEVAPEEPDPYVGDSIDLVRGVRKAAWRLYVFYDLFALAVAFGLVLLMKDLKGSAARFVWAWSLTYLALNLASGGLRGPNLLRYNKDLEIVAPLFCVALGCLGVWLWRKSRWMGALYATSFVCFGVIRAVTYLTEKFALER